MKAELTVRLPKVKSSHRCEALARGLGFGTYSSAKAASETIVRVRGELFRDYLKDRGIDVSPECLFLVAARIAIHQVADRYPELTTRGLGFGRPTLNAQGRWESPQEVFKRFQDDRSELFDDSTTAGFLASLSLLGDVLPTRTVRPGTGSYWLKHIAEKCSCSYPTGEKLGPVYVTNGAFIAAALHAGFKMKRHRDELGYDAVSVTFNMSKKRLVDIDCEVRPDGAHAQDRRRLKEWNWSRH